MNASVVITTKDRKDELRRAIKSAIWQTEPIEILVLDDGSSDGTSDMVRSEFPHVRLDRTPTSLGCVAQRNRGVALCSGKVIFSMDDDAEFSTARVVEHALASFNHPRIAAIAIPYIEPKNSRQMFQCAPNDSAIWVTDSFRGTSHALRRDVFLALGGYREQIIHQGEEMDYCFRLLNGGFVVRLGTGDPILHHESAERDWGRMDFYGRRNDIAFAWRNVPMPYLGIHLLGTTLKGITFAIRANRFSGMIGGILSGYLDIFLNWRSREPVSPKSYRLHRLLKKHGARKLADIEALLPPLTMLRSEHACGDAGLRTNHVGSCEQRV
jgi:glycosyltransferase involved in cell wall biosynthesis